MPAAPGLLLTVLLALLLAPGCAGPAARAPAWEPDLPTDPCADIDLLDGLDSPCFIDVDLAAELRSRPVPARPEPSHRHARRGPARQAPSVVP